jgi:hypothetical protein
LKLKFVSSFFVNGIMSVEGRRVAVIQHVDVTKVLVDKFNSSGFRNEENSMRKLQRIYKWRQIPGTEMLRLWTFLLLVSCVSWFNWLGGKCKHYIFHWLRWSLPYLCLNCSWRGQLPSCTLG